VTTNVNVYLITKKKATIKIKLLKVGSLATPHGKICTRIMNSIYKIVQFMKPFFPNCIYLLLTTSFIILSFYFFGILFNTPFDISSMISFRISCSDFFFVIWLFAAIDVFIWVNIIPISLYLCPISLY
jgi:hypothetical protein